MPSWWLFLVKTVPQRRLHSVLHTERFNDVKCVVKPREHPQRLRRRHGDAHMAFHRVVPQDAVATLLSSRVGPQDRKVIDETRFKWVVLDFICGKQRLRRCACYTHLFTRRATSRSTRRAASLRRSRLEDMVFSFVRSADEPGIVSHAPTGHLADVERKTGTTAITTTSQTLQYFLGPSVQGMPC